MKTVFGLMGVILFCTLIANENNEAYRFSSATGRLHAIGVHHQCGPLLCMPVDQDTRLLDTQTIVSVWPSTPIEKRTGTITYEDDGIWSESGDVVALWDAVHSKSNGLFARFMSILSFFSNK